MVLRLRGILRQIGEELRQAGDLCWKFNLEHLRGLANSEALRQYLNEAWAIYHNTCKQLPQDTAQATSDAHIRSSSSLNQIE